MNRSVRNSYILQPRTRWGVVSIFLWILLAFAFFLAPIFAPLAHAQRENTFYARQYQQQVTKPVTVGKLVEAAQNACHPDTSIPCVIVIDPDLRAFTEGTMPAKCAQCTWTDWRTPGTAGGGLSYGANLYPTLTQTLPTEASLSGIGQWFSAYCDPNEPDAVPFWNLPCGFFMHRQPSPYSVPDNEFIFSAYYHPAIIIQNMQAAAGHRNSIIFRREKNGDGTNQHQWMLQADPDANDSNGFGIFGYPDSGNTVQRLQFRGKQDGTGAVITPALTGQAENDQGFIQGNLDMFGLFQATSKLNDAAGRAAIGWKKTDAARTKLVATNSNAYGTTDLCFTRDRTPVCLLSFGLDGANGVVRSLTALDGSGSAVAINIPNNVTSPTILPPQTTAGVGGFMGGSFFPAGMSGGSVIVTGANQVHAIQMNVPVRITIRKLAWYQSVAGAAGTKVAWSLWDSTRTTKLVDSGVQAADGANGQKTVTLGTPVTLDAGVYYFAWTSDSAAYAAYGLTGFGAVMGSVMGATGVSRVGLATNAAAAGVFPSTLGTLANSLAVVVPAVMFEP